MSDWRIDNWEKEVIEYFTGMPLLKIKFPCFWQQALKTKNNFFKNVYLEAEYNVKKLNTGAEYLTDALCCQWWGDTVVFV